jgi:peptidoglycan/xylan/chitin deacetylase (PgdA/CDA1 family)
MPVTVFVCPGRLNSASFWWDRYDLQDSAGLNAAAREHALSALGGREAAVTEFAGGNDWKVREEPAHIGCASESDLRSISKMPEVTLGSHSWSHPNLVALSEDQLRIELADSRSWLRDRFVNTISCISYPYGLFDDRVQLAARNCGYDFGLAISGGWMSPRVESSFAVPRLNIPAGISTEGFQCRLAGLFC